MWLCIVFAGLVGLVTGMPHLHHNVGTSKSNHLTIEDFIAAKNDDFSFQEAQEDVLNGRNPELGEHFEGDIILPEGVNPQNGILQDSKLWPNAIVPYTITGNFTTAQRALIAAAIATYNKVTCIRFVPRKSTDVNYAYFQNGAGGCSSSVGRVGGKQAISLHADCFAVGKGTVMHEMMHTVGFYHEQSRMDRNNSINIYLKNVIPGHEFNFQAEPSRTFGLGYDYGSIMHYPKYAFSIAPGTKATILPKNSTTITIGQRVDFSKTDISKLNLMYKCKVKDAMNEGTDKNGHCQFWASEGECDTHKEFMAEECPESCANQ